MNVRKLAAGCVLPAVLLAGCSAHSDRAGIRRIDRPAHPGEAGAAELEPVIVDFEATPELREPDGDPYAMAELSDDGLAAGVSASRTYYEVGKEAFRHGDMDTAREFFGFAIDALCEVSDADDPQSEVLLDTLTGYVAAYEVAFSAWDDAMEIEERSIETAAIDSLRVVELPDIPSPPRVISEKSNVRVHNDVPLVVNNQVQYMLDVYKGRLKDEIAPAFRRSGRWLPMMHQILKEEGVPLDMAWLSLVESGFKPTAYSSARAKGLWQFIRSTGRMYGLSVDHWVDERADPLKATRAAARHLRDLYENYGDWYLALAAYNAGPGKVNRAIRKTGAKDYWAIARTSHLRRETKNYVPAYLATLLIAQDPAAHGFDLDFEQPWDFETVTVDGPSDLAVLARCAGTTADELQALNPELRRGSTPGHVSEYTLRVPVGASKQFATEFAKLPKSERQQYAMHVVKRGETLGRIAARYGVRIDTIVAANRLSNSHRISVGANLQIPMSAAAAASIARHDDDDDRPRSNRATHYRVRRGDTLSSIARRHGVSVVQLRQWNRLKSDRIVVGARLRTAGDSSARSSVRQQRSSQSAAAVHRVRRGDTLSSIARRYGVTVAQLRSWNSLRGNRIVIGQRLAVAATAAKTAKRTLRHRVRRGESLWKIAKRYGVSVGDLARWNGRGRRDVLQTGQRLKVMVE